MPLHKVSSVYVRTVEGQEVQISRSNGDVSFAIADGETLTFTAEDLREIVTEFAPRERKQRGPNKRTTGAQQNGQADESRVSA